MIKDFTDVIKGNSVPIRSSKRFYKLAKSRIIGDKKAREIIQKTTGKKYFGSIKEFTDYAAKRLNDDFLRGIK